MRFLKIVALLCIFNTTHAQIEEKRIELTRNKAVYTALSRNPQLSAVSTGIDAANGRFEQSGRLDNPVLSVGYGNDFLFNAENEDGLVVSLSQKFPLFGRLSKEEDIAKIDIQLAQLEFEQAKRDLAKEVEITYINCLKLNEVIKASQKQLDLIKQIRDHLHSEYKKAQSSELEYLNSMNEYEQLNIEIQQDLVDLDTQLIKLKNLLYMQADEEIYLSDELSVLENKEIKYDKEVLDLRPDYQMLMKAKESTKAQIALINANKFEDIEVGIFFETNRTTDEPVGLKRGSAMGISMSIALPIKSYQGAISEQLAMRRKAEKLADEKEISIKNEIIMYNMRFNKFGDILRLNHSKLIEKSLKIYTQYTKAYKEAQVSITDVFTAWESHLKILKMNADIKAQQAINEIELNYALGIFKYEK